MSSGKPAPGNAAPGSDRKSRLGRGLSSLIRTAPEVAEELTPTASTEIAVPSDAPAAGVPAEPVIVERVVEKFVEKLVDRVVEVPTGNPIMVPIDRIRPNPHQPRRTFTEASLRELADSIENNGIIQPLVVRKLGIYDGGSWASYELIAGERRLRASKLAGLESVPVVIKEVDQFDQAQMALVENIQREDLNAIERAEGYRSLISQLGFTQAELAARLGEDRSTVANFLRLLDLTANVQRLVREGILSVGHGKLLAGVNDVLEQERLAKLVLQQGLSVRNLEKAILESATGSAPTPPPTAADAKTKQGLDAHYAELEKSIARQIGMRVNVKAGRSKGKGKVTIHYGSLDQFDQLMERLGVEVE